MYVLKQLTLLHHSALYGILFKELAVNKERVV